MVTRCGETLSLDRPIESPFPIFMSLQLFERKSIAANSKFTCRYAWNPKLAHEGRFDYLLVESTGLSEPLPGAEPRLDRRTVLTFPLLPPPQKN
jgi:hypothetical protein